MSLDLEIDNVIAKIKQIKAKSVLIQLPDGLKPQAKGISDKLESETKAKIYIYLGTCFGACDVPQNLKPDLIVQWGHSDWS